MNTAATFAVQGTAFEIGQDLFERLVSHTLISVTTQMRKATPQDQPAQVAQLWAGVLAYATVQMTADIGPVAAQALLDQLSITAGRLADEESRPKH